MADTVVLYHKNCYDGFGAAWAAWRKFGDQAAYIPVNYGDPLPEAAWGCSLYVLDFSFPRKVLEKRSLDEGYLLNVSDLCVLDHHKTAEADLRGLPFCTFNMEQSGAMLAWEHFHPGEDAPPLIQYVQDRDLWRFNLRGSREVAAWLRSYPMDFNAWEFCHEYLIGYEDSVIMEGEAILRFQSQMVSMMCDNAWETEIGGHRVPVTNATVFFSEVGEELCKRFSDAPFGAYYLDRKDGKRQWGVRSLGRLDVSILAKTFGGGGHPGAAGWTEERP